MLQIIGITLLISIFWMNKKVLQQNYKILNPISIYTTIWIMVMLVHNFYFTNDSHTEIAYTIILCGSFSLAIGFWLFANKNITLGKRNTFQVTGYDEAVLAKVIRIICVIEVIRVIYSIYIVIYKLAGSWNTFLYAGTYVRNKYLAYNGGTIANLFEFFCNSTVFIGYTLVGVYCARKSKKYKLLLIEFCVLEVIYALITMSKMCLIIYAIVLATSYLNNLDTINDQKKIFRRTVPFIALAAFAFLMTIAFQRNYMASGGNLRDTVIKQAAIYFSGPTEALGLYVQNNKSELTMGMRTFVILGRILQRIGIIGGTSLLEHGVNIDIGYDTINAYSWFKVFYEDYSYLGIIIIPFFLGVLAGMMYNNKSKDLFSEVCNSWLTAVFGMAFYTFMWGQTVYVFILIYAYILHKTIGRKLYYY